MSRADFFSNIKELVATAKISKAITELSSFVESEGHEEEFGNQLILLSARYRGLERDRNMGIISGSKANISMNQISYALLSLVDEIEKSKPESASKGYRSRREKEEDTASSQSNKNVISESDIKADGNVHIGDIYYVNGEGKVESKKKEEDTGGKEDSKKSIIENIIEGEGELRILFLAANPIDRNNLRLDKEMREIEVEISRSRYREKIKLIKRTAVRIKDLQHALLIYSPHFIHFAGHGTNRGVALLDNQTDKTQIIRSENLANLLKLFSKDIVAVFLNSCYSDAQGKEIKKYIPHVIGMNSAVEDETAIVFASAFYQVIGAGRAINFAFDFAVNSIDLNNIVGSNIPVYLNGAEKKD